MSGQKIQNQQTNVPNTKAMNDKYFIITEKHITASYNTALSEASHQQLYQPISSICNEAEQCMCDLFNTMFQKGWYSLEGAK